MDEIKILNLPSNSSTAVHRIVLGKGKDPIVSERSKDPRPINTRLKNKKAVIGGKDWNWKI